MSMSLYKRFCHETFDAEGTLTDFLLDYPENFNFAWDVVDAIAAETPDKTAIVWCNEAGEEHHFTFAEVRDESMRMANVFRESGIRRGNSVLLVLKRHYSYWFAVIALHRIGAVGIPTTHLLTASDFTYRLRKAQPTAVICVPCDGVPQKLQQAAAAYGLPPICWTLSDSVPGFRNLLDETAKAPAAMTRPETSVHDSMLLYFTSGTTGEPKGVIHDYSYPLAHIITAKYWQHATDGGLHFTVAETGWGKASWGKLYGQWLVGSAVMVYDFDRFDPRALCAVINRFGVTSFCAPPTIYRYLVLKDIPEMPTLRHASTAGEQLSPEVFRKFANQTGLTFSMGYGQTETALLLADFAADGAAPGTLGTPSPLYNLALIDESGAPVADNEIGEVVVAPPDGIRTPGIFSSYLDNDTQYAYAWRDGVYHTGDAAYRDENGHWWFHGRFDDIIKTGGYRVGPYEVENVLMEDPAVAECSVIGIPDTLRGQAIKAFVVLAEGIVPDHYTATAIRNAANRRLAEYKWIRLVEFVRELPKTISGKIKKTKLRQRR